MKLAAVGIIAVVLLVVGLFCLPRYQIVPTNFFNVGGIYKLDTRTGKLWICAPVTINVDKTNIVPGKGCYPIENMQGVTASGGSQI